MSRFRMLVPLLLVGLLGAVILGCTSSPPTGTEGGERVDGYVALVPKILRSGETASFSLSLFNGKQLAKSQ